MRQFILFLIGILFFSCEEEDICTEGSTPRLVIQTKNSQESSIEIDSIQIYRSQNQNDSLILKATLGNQHKIPLLLKKAPSTKFIFKTYQKNHIWQDELTIGYDYELKYISKACGYRVQYNNLKVKFNSGFFKQVEVLNPTLDHETTAHLLFYY